MNTAQQPRRFPRPLAAQTPPPSPRSGCQRRLPGAVGLSPSGGTGTRLSARRGQAGATLSAAVAEAVAGAALQARTLSGVWGGGFKGGGRLNDVGLGSLTLVPRPSPPAPPARVPHTLPLGQSRASSRPPPHAPAAVTRVCGVWQALGGLLVGPLRVAQGDPRSLPISLPISLFPAGGSSLSRSR